MASDSRLPVDNDTARQESDDSIGSASPETTLLAYLPATRQRYESESSSAVPRLVRGSRPFFSSAQWTADGTTVIIKSSDNTVSSVALPADLLENPGQRLQPEPYATLSLPEPTQALVTNPGFSLAEPATQTYLVGCRHHPLHLYHAFPGDCGHGPLASYKLVRTETEEFIYPASLLWLSAGTHFLSGSTNRLDCFDVSRYGSDGPVLSIPTIPSKRHITKRGGVGMKGTVSALAGAPSDAGGSGLVAAGTRTRWIGLYDLDRSQLATANWSIARADCGSGFDFDHGGLGIVQLAWSRCGRYLVVNERCSSNLLVYDIRGTGKLLSVLGGRQATSQQRLACDLYQGDDAGFEVWAGAADGSVHVWDKVGQQHGSVQPSCGWQPHESPVGSIALHSCGSVAATCSGAWELVSDRDVEDFGTGRDTRAGIKNTSDSSLKIWSVGIQGLC